MPVYQLLGGKTPQRRRRLCPRLGRHHHRARGRCPPLLGGGLHRHPLPARRLRRRRLPRSRQCPRAPRTTGRRKKAFDDDAYLEIHPQRCSSTCATSSAGVRSSPTTCTSTSRPPTRCSWPSSSSPTGCHFSRICCSPEQVRLAPPGTPAMRHPQAMGELFINPHEYLPLITERLIDFVRVPCVEGRRHHPGPQDRARCCEWFGVQTARQEGGDNDPVNQMAAMHVDLASTRLRHPGGEPLQARGVSSLFEGHAILERRLPLRQRATRASASTSTKKGRRPARSGEGQKSHHRPKTPNGSRERRHRRVRQPPSCSSGTP